MKISLIIPTRNRIKGVKVLLDCIENQNFDKTLFQVFLIDDGSTVSLENIINTKKYNYSLNILRKKHEGIAKARNYGVMASDGDLIIFSDDDVILEPDFIRNHYQLHINNDNLLVSGSVRQVPLSLIKKYIDEKIGLQIIRDSSSFHPYYNVVYKMLQFKRKRLPLWVCVSGANMSIKKENFGILYGFDSNFSGWCPDDIEFSYRAFLNKINILIDPSIIVYHIFYNINLKERINDIVKAYNYFGEKHCTNSVKSFINFLWGKDDLATFLNNSIDDCCTKSSFFNKLIGEYFDGFSKFKEITLPVI